MEWTVASAVDIFSEKKKKIQKFLEKSLLSV